MANRKRNIQMKFYVTEDEKRLIDEKMSQLPTRRYGAYLRKMAIDGYIIYTDTADIKHLPKSFHPSENPGCGLHRRSPCRLDCRTSRPSRQPKPQNGKISLLIDIQNNIKAQQSAGFTHWAKLNNLKQATKTMNFLTEHGISSYGELESKLTAISARRDTAHAEIKRIESRSAELALVMKHAGTYRQLDCHAENHRTGYANQQVRGMETEPRRGKRCREAVPNGKQLAGEVSTGRKPEACASLSKGYTNRRYGRFSKNSFFMFISARSDL